MRKSFYFLFAGLALAVSAAMGLVMYLQYQSYITQTYTETLSRVAALIEDEYPVLKDLDRLKQGAAGDEDWFWKTSGELNAIARAFDLAYIYYIERTGRGYVFRMSSVISRENHPEWLDGPVWGENTAVPEGFDEAYDTGKMTFTPRPTHNEWGGLVSGMLPVLSGGKTVGLLGLSYDISFVAALRRKALFALAAALAVSVFVASLLAAAGSRTVLVPITEKELAAREADERRKEIESLAEALKAASVSKSAFLANISHELRTPLNVIIGLSTILLGKEEMPPAFRENLEDINESGMMLLRVINDILDINKIDADRLEIVPVLYELPDLITGVTMLSAVNAKEELVGFELVLDESLPLKLFGDEPRIRQICGKLLNNAFSHTKKGGVSLEISSKKDGKSVLVTFKVRDTGSGIRPDLLERIFIDYGGMDEGVHRGIGGTGLGLVIAKRTAQLMGGDLIAESVWGGGPGQTGSVFVLTVRQRLISDEQIGPVAAEELKNFRYTGSKRDYFQKLGRLRLPGANVLVVDDIPVNLKVAAGILEPYNMKVDCVSSGREAIELIRNAAVKYNLILMDYMMPDLDGIETTRIIRGELGTMYAKTVPIIALTAAEFASDQEFLQNGFNGCLRKPIDIMRLDEAINHWIRGVETASTQMPPA